MISQQDRKITRNREFRSCVECRKRKLRCDRHRPCSSCTRRGEESTCIYDSNLKGARAQHAEKRLERLERMIQELKSQQSSPISHDTSSNSSLATHDPSATVLYNGPTHWSAMLDEIEGLRATIEAQDLFADNGHPQPEQDDGLRIIHGEATAPALGHILADALPSRSEADRLVATYFRAKAVAAPFIHAGQFRRLYNFFWEDPMGTSALWTSILFSVFDIAQCTRLMGSPHGSERRFAVAAAQCLVAGGHHEPQPFSVEALLLYLQARCITGSEISPKLAILFGTLVRMATIMGYHREAFGSRAGLSVFDREMRRRTWSLCLQLDVLISFQLGLPSNVQYPTWDTRPPSNLLDTDFDEDTTKLPPSRADQEQTEISFYIAKHRLISIFERVLRSSLTTAGVSDDVIQALDGQLRDTYAALPSVFHVRPMSDSIVDPPSVIVTRLCVYFIYQKSLCVLHRQRLVAESGNEDSLRVCCEAASGLVRQLIDIHREFEHGGQLEAEQWFLGSITWHDFLIGCTTLCLVLCVYQGRSPVDATEVVVDSVSIIELLQRAREICEERYTKGASTQKVTQLLKVVLSRYGSNQLSDKDPKEWLDGFSSDGSRELSYQNPRDWIEWAEGSNDPTWDFMARCLELTDNDAALGLL